jgi:hypothetical protein
LSGAVRCPKCNEHRVSQYEMCGDQEVLTFRCMVCGHTFPAHIVSGSAWRGDPLFCRLARDMWSEDYRLATTRDEKGSYQYDRGASQKLQYRWQGYRMLLDPEQGFYVGSYLGVSLVFVRPEGIVHEQHDQQWKTLKEKILAKLRT